MQEEPQQKEGQQTTIWPTAPSVSIARVTNKGVSSHFPYRGGKKNGSTTWIVRASITFSPWTPVSLVVKTRAVRLLFSCFPTASIDATGISLDPIKPTRNKFLLFYLIRNNIQFLPDSATGRRDEKLD
jgi:hypothetical protein